MSSDPSSSLEEPLPSGPVCNICANQNPATARCNTCNRFLCNLCNLAHKLYFQTHQVMELVEPESRCFLHDGQTRTYFCRTCDIVICSECIGHSKHDFFIIHHGMISEIKNAVTQLTYLNYKLDLRMEDLTQFRFTVFGYVNEMHENCDQLLKKYRDYLITKIEERYEEQKKNIVEVKLEVVGIINEFTSKLDKATEATNLLTLSSSNSKEKSASATSFFDSEETPNPFVLEPNPHSSNTYSDPSSSIPCTTNNVNSMQIYKTFGQKGAGSGQFNSPHGLCLGYDEDIVVADSINHRVQVFDKTGIFKYQFGISGRHEGHLWHPRKIALLPTKRQFVVCDRGYERSRMQIFSVDGKFIKKISIHYVDIVAGVAVTEDENIVIVDSVTPNVFIIGLNEFLRSLDCSDFVKEPSDIKVLGKEMYICDFKGHSVVVMDDEGNFLRKFGSEGITSFPNGIDVTSTGEVLIGDSHGNFFHVSVYSTKGTFLAEFRCPYVKVSRCCGLNVTSDGYIVTVDKNYHHVLMLRNPKVN